MNRIKDNKFLNALLLILFVNLVASPEWQMAQAQSLVRVAVISIEDNSTSGKYEKLIAALPNLLNSQLANNKRIDVVERSRLIELLNEMKLSMTGLILESTAQQIGRTLGLNFVILGNFVEIGGEFRIDMRILEVESGKIITGNYVQGRESQLFDLIDSLAEKIEGSIKGNLFGSLSVSSKPSDAELYLDLELKGKTPIRMIDLAENLYRLDLRLEGYETYNSQVQINKGKETSLKIDLIETDVHREKRLQREDDLRKAQLSEELYRRELESQRIRANQERLAILNTRLRELESQEKVGNFLAGSGVALMLGGGVLGPIFMSGSSDRAHRTGTYLLIGAGVGLITFIIGLPLGMKAYREKMNVQAQIQSLQ
jgi:TolB-like protein